jgi:short-subunit dehydrogenase
MTAAAGGGRPELWRRRYGPWAVVTGASEGIGEAFARCLAAAGLRIVLVARRRARLERLALELAERHGAQTLVVELDVGRPEALAALAGATQHLEVGLLVAAAGFGTSGRFIDGATATELEMIDVNCRAVAGHALHFGRLMAARRRGGLVLMSSLLAFQGVPRAANYAATKAYVQVLAEGLSRELVPCGVDVVASAPGPIHSGFARRATMDMAVAQPPQVVAEGTLAALGRRTTVRPGWLSKGLGLSLAGLPRAARVRIMAAVMAGMTRRQHDKTNGEDAGGEGRDGEDAKPA